MNDPAIGQIVLVGDERLATRLADGRVVEFQRRCPHRQHDLLTATVVDDHITCPLHKWRFDLNSGELLTQIPPAMYKVKPRLDCVAVQAAQERPAAD